MTRNSRLRTRRAEPTDDPVAAARARALKLLARREHGRAELIAKLVQRGHEAAVCEQVCDALAKANMLSEARFLEHFVSVKSGRGAGPRRIEAELRAKGVAKADAQEALGEAGVDWVAACDQVRRKRFGAALPSEVAERLRQARFLEQRGFTSEQVRKVLKGDVEGS